MNLQLLLSLRLPLFWRLSRPRRVLNVLLLITCPFASAASPQPPALADYLGDYVGQWNTEVSADEYDDISRYELKESVMRLALSEEGTLRMAFFLDRDAAAANQPLDLLGFGCGSQVGELLSLGLVDAVDAVDSEGSDGSEPTYTVLEASFDFDWGNCPSRVYAFAANDLKMELALNPVDREYVARLSLLRKLQPANQTYMTQDGQRRRVVIRKKSGGTLYRPAHEYCVVNDVGETEECFDRRSEVKHLVVPFPLPGLSAVWWTSRDKIEVVEGRQALYHEAVFRRALPDDAEH
jgi:hypothetical protein